MDIDIENMYKFQTVKMKTQQQSQGCMKGILFLNYMFYSRLDMQDKLNFISNVQLSSLYKLKLNWSCNGSNFLYIMCIKFHLRFVQQGISHKFLKHKFHFHLLLSHIRKLHWGSTLLSKSSKLMSWLDRKRHKGMNIEMYIAM